MIRLRAQILNGLRRLAEWLYVGVVARQLYHKDKTELRRLLRRELAAIPETIASYAAYQHSEALILSDRLARRFDPGMALNEAAARAIEAKKLAGQPNPDNLTAGQKAALEVQKQYLDRIVRQA